MTKHEIETMLNDMAGAFVEQAMHFRVTAARVVPFAAVISENGDLKFVAFDHPDDRVVGLKATCRESGGVAFLFLSDAYVRTGDSTQVCAACKGVGCDACRWCGHPITASHEAIVIQLRTKWGYKRAMSYPYTFTNGKLTRLATTQHDGDSEMLDSYEEVWTNEIRH